MVNEKGQKKAVIIPIKIWKEMLREMETAYLLSNEVMKNRLIEAKERKNGIPWEEVCKKLGI
jgi:PHD/YefM family antitoxin component YafN of YafNO toxin-antitoxin module